MERVSRELSVRLNKRLAVGSAEKDRLRPVGKLRERFVHQKLHDTVPEISGS